MRSENARWDLLILDAGLPDTTLAGLAVGDLDRDGNVEMVVGGSHGLYWYRPATLERGVIACPIEAHVGLALEDLDGDGMLEVVVGHAALQAERFEDMTWQISWFDPPADIHQPWTRHIIALSHNGPHDLVFADLDGDGENELVANGVYCTPPGLYLYRRGCDVTQPWQRTVVQEGTTGEGTAVADLDGDGRPEIVSGPYYYVCPPTGPFSSPWLRRDLSVGFREYCRTAVVDITGNGRPDVVQCESEYLDGRMSWFENRLVEDPDHPWAEHRLDQPLVFAHSLQAWRDPATRETRVFVAEMGEGGWNAGVNHDARLLTLTSADGGRNWRREELYHGYGTHQSVLEDLDGDSQLEVAGKDWFRPNVYLYKRTTEPSPLVTFRHHFLDRDKPCTGTDLLAADVDGDGLEDVVCAAWWYKSPSWQRYAIPGVYQVINAHDLDGDGRLEFIATKRNASPEGTWYDGLSDELCWLKPVDPINGVWEEYPIGQGNGDWPHGSLVAPLLPGGQLALVLGYHSANMGERSYPTLFQIPSDPRQYPWPKRVLAEVVYGEEFQACDLNGDGLLDIVAGRYWLENLGDGHFSPHLLIAEEGIVPARVVVADVNGDGWLDIVIGQEVVDWQAKSVPPSPLLWCENPGREWGRPWKTHVIDKVYCAHSLGAADLDGDGQMEIVCGEHVPFRPYRSRSRLFVYKKGDAQGTTWWRYLLDNRFEHHSGAKIISLSSGRLGIISHGWTESQYVHLWEPC